MICQMILRNMSSRPGWSRDPPGGCGVLSLSPLRPHLSSSSSSSSLPPFSSSSSFSSSTPRLSLSYPLKDFTAQKWCVVPLPEGRSRWAGRVPVAVVAVLPPLSLEMVLVWPPPSLHLGLRRTRALSRRSRAAFCGSLPADAHDALALSAAFRPRRPSTTNPLLQTLAVDLLNPSLEHERESHKLKRLVQSPNSFFMVRRFPSSFL
jgi:hypothetical protein